jgi:glucose/arabinose dehydrogenase
MKKAIIILANIVFLFTSFLVIEDKKDNAPKENYQEYCSGCHGETMIAFVDRKWKYGNTDEDLFKSIKYGYPDDGMSSYDTTFTDQEIKDLVTYIQDGIKDRKSYDFEDTFDDSQLFEYGEVSIKLQLISEAASSPWGMTFLPDGSMLITDKAGDLIHQDPTGKTIIISGTPEVNSNGQGGLMDVELHPEFPENRIIYLSYSKLNPDGEGQTTAIMMAKLENDKLVDAKDLYVAQPYLPTRHHYGSRLEFGIDGKLYFSVGDRGRRDDNPQFLNNSCGKIHRLNLDGSIPEDNPFVDQEDAMKSIWSYGHRNPQGLALNPVNGELWSNEHGPRGGDEINQIKKGKNYGWPVISYGINYNGTTFTNKTAEDGMLQPVHQWTPSLGVCGMTFINSDRYGPWNGQLLSGSLRFKYLNLSYLAGGEVVKEERLLKNVGRLRSVEMSPDGFIYVGVEKPGKIYKLIPM